MIRKPKSKKKNVAKLLPPLDQVIANQHLFNDNVNYDFSTDNIRLFINKCYRAIIEHSWNEPLRDNIKKNIIGRISIEDKELKTETKQQIYSELNRRISEYLNSKARKISQWENEKENNVGARSGLREIEGINKILGWLTISKENSRPARKQKTTYKYIGIAAILDTIDLSHLLKKLEDNGAYDSKTKIFTGLDITPRKPIIHLAALSYALFENGRLKIKPGTQGSLARMLGPAFGRDELIKLPNGKLIGANFSSFKPAQVQKNKRLIVEYKNIFPARSAKIED